MVHAAWWSTIVCRLVSRTISKICGTTRFQEDKEYSGIHPCITVMATTVRQVLIALLVYLPVIRGAVELAGVVMNMDVSGMEHGRTLPPQKTNKLLASRSQVPDLA